MIQITPAILARDQKQLRSVLERYIRAGFESVDIDIQAQPFVSHETIGLEEALIVLKEFEPLELAVGWDLKLAQPEGAVNTLLGYYEQVETPYSMYVYSNADVNFLAELDLDEQFIGLGVLGNEEVPPIDELELFPEVQIMTIKSEQQGQVLDIGLLERVQKIVDDGYPGEVSIDGGVNLKSATDIVTYPVSRVSVGSYFQNSLHPQTAFTELEEALSN